MAIPMTPNRTLAIMAVRTITLPDSFLPYRGRTRSFRICLLHTTYFELRPHVSCLRTEQSHLSIREAYLYYRLTHASMALGAKSALGLSRHSQGTNRNG